MNKKSWLTMLAVLASGCSLVLDLETKQCQSKQDCEQLTEKGKDDTYLCVQGVCRYETCDADKGDAYCQEFAKDYGDAFKTAICDEDPLHNSQLSCMPSECARTEDCEAGKVCDTLGNRCVNRGAAMCKDGTHDECQRYDGLPTCVANTCEASQCKVDKDCVAISPSATCDKGACVDPAWSCVDTPDDREPTASGVATYEIIVYDAVTQKIPPDLQVELCGNALDTGCLTPPPGAVAEVDYANDKVILRGLPQDERTQAHFIMTGEGMFPTEMISFQRIVGDTVMASSPIYLIPTALVPLVTMASGTTETVDVIKNSTLITRIFDCANELAPNMRLTFDVMQKSTRTFILREGNITDADATVTDSYGTIGVSNMVPAKSTVVTYFVGEESTEAVSSAQFTPQAATMMYVHVYPRRL